MASVRPPAVAGLFYNADAAALRAEVAAYVDVADVEPRDTLRAAIGPHAGYAYSGPICGTAYAALAARREAIRRVVLIGPSHRVPFTGLATSSARAFATPIGEVAVDRDGVAQLEQHDVVAPHDESHAPEHGLEVHLPFIQVALGEEVPIIPVLFSDVTARDTAEALRPLLDEATLLMVSSDLSHYHAYEQAKQIDRATADAIEQGNVAALTGSAACGHVAIQALMLLADELGVAPRTLDLRSSGDTAGPHDRVVGYGAFAYD